MKSSAILQIYGCGKRKTKHKIKMRSAFNHCDKSAADMFYEN